MLALGRELELGLGHGVPGFHLLVCELVELRAGHSRDLQFLLTLGWQLVVGPQCHQEGQVCALLNPSLSPRFYSSVTCVRGPAHFLVFVVPDSGAAAG